MSKENAACAADSDRANKPADTAPVRRERLVATKLQPPTYAGDLVCRRLLLERLAAARGCRLALIRAPAGYGKTTLAVQWRDALQYEGAAVAWLNLDEDDNDPTRFLSYLIAGLAKVDGALGQDLLSALEAHSEEATKFILGDLINNIAVFGQDLFLMLDDWHLIHEQRIQDALAFLLSHAPANFHILITSRRRLPLPLARLRVEGQVVEIDAGELRFDADESRQFIQDINDLALSDDALRLLWQTTDGWVAALQLASLSLRASTDPDASLKVFSDESGRAGLQAIGEYLAENVLDNLPAATLDFLTRTSILDRLSAPLCVAVSGNAESQRILEQLEGQDLFIRPLDEKRQWFRYHHLFAAYLRRRLVRDHPEAVQALHRAACAWFAAQGHVSEAVGHALQAGEMDRAIDLVERDAMWLVEHSRMASLLGLVKRLPARRLVDRPNLQMAIGWAHCLTHHPDRVTNALNLLDASLADRAQDDDAAAQLRAEARLLRGSTGIYGDHVQSVEELVKPCLEEPEAHRPWVVAVAANVLSWVRIQSFDFAGARSLQTWALVYHERTQGPFSGIYGRCFAGMAAAQQGELRAAAEQFRDALALARETAGRHSHAARLAGALWGRINYEYNDLEHAENLLEEARALGAEGGVADFSLATYIFLARLRAQAGDVAAAHSLLDEGAQTALQLGIERLAAAVDGERVRFYLAEGDIHLAERALVPAAELAPAATGIDVQIWETRELARARVERAQGQSQAALARLQALLELARAHGRGLAATCLRVPLALALEDSGESARAQATLAQALELAAPQGMIRTFLDEGAQPSLERLREAARHGKLLPPLSAAAVYHLNRIIAAGRGAPEPAGPVPSPGQGTPPRTEFFVEPLKTRELQMIRLLGKGCSNKEIARNLGVGVNTVKWYLKSAYAKLCVSRRTQAVAEAKRLGLLD